MIKGEIKVVPYQWYEVNIEVLRPVLKDSIDTRAIITMGCGSSFRERFGICKPSTTHKICTFYDCTRRNPDTILNKRMIQCPGGDFKIELSYSNQVHDRSCKWKKTMATAVARVSMTPVPGDNIFNVICKHRCY